MVIRPFSRKDAKSINRVYKNRMMVFVPFVYFVVLLLIYPLKSPIKITTI